MLSLNSCEQKILAPTAPSLRLFSSLSGGGSLEYDEEIIDSVVVPPAYLDSSDAFKIKYANKNRSLWHVKVTVPDTAVKFFRIEKTAQILSSRDSSFPDAQMIWKTVSYGNTFQQYDKNGSLLHTETLQMESGLENDLDDLPINYRENVVLADSIQDSIINSMIANGQIVTENNGVVSSVSTISEGPITFTMTATFDPDCFCETSISVLKGSNAWMSSTINWSVVDDLRIATTTITDEISSLPSSRRSIINNMLPGDVNPTFDYDITHRKIVNLTNIVIPD